MSSQHPLDENQPGLYPNFFQTSCYRGHPLVLVLLYLSNALNILSSGIAFGDEAAVVAC